MKFINDFRMLRSLCILVCSFVFAGLLSGQSFRFRNYGPGDNLPSNVIYTINQDRNGYLWIGTTQGISRFDGFDFFSIAFPDSAFSRYPSCSLKDNDERLWFGCNDGTLFWSDGSSLNKVKLSNSSVISCLVQGPDGNIYAVPQRKAIFRINPRNPEEIDTLEIPGDPVMFSAAFSGSGKLLIGTQDNIMVCDVNKSSPELVSVIEGFDYSSVTAIQPVNEGNWYLIGTDGNGLFRLFLTDAESELSRFPDDKGLASFSVKSLLMADDQSIWVSTAEAGAVKLLFIPDNGALKSVRFFDNNSGLPGNYVSVVFQDAEHNLWLGFNGSGLSLFSSESFSFIAPGGGSGPDNVIHVDRFRNNNLLGTPSGYYIYDPSASEVVSFTRFPGGISEGDVSAYNVDEEGSIWFGTKGRGLFVQKADGTIRQFYRSGDTGSDYITHIEKDKENIWLATLNGIKILSVAKGELKKSYNINNGLPHNSINQLFLTPEGSAWIALESDRMYRVDPDSGIIVSDALMRGLLLNKILSVTQSSDGVVWAATQGNGVFRCAGDSVKAITTADGLFSNYAYSIFADSENDIWIGHERGYSRYSPSTGIIKVFETDFARRGSCNADGMYQSPDGKIYIGTTEGLIVYDPARDRKPVAPVNNINSIVINDIEYPYRPVFHLPYKKRYNVRINYVGINLSNPDKVYYSTFLENYNDDYTRLSSTREVSYSLRDGRYRFNLLSVNEEGLSNETPLSFEIIIKSPVWRSWWFLLSVLVLMGFIVVLIVREREKAQKKIQEYLEKELEARTEVIRNQKTEIEQQNLEITDSINYAKRIQSSLLPDLYRLREHFAEAFVLLYPRDIVSGDFYWFDKLHNDRFVLVCADSTGHGVPGAFMSVIGATLLQDIVTRQGISRPSEILSKLDKQIFSTLNQNLEAGVSNDGMDMVVCEFTMKNRHVRFASAMRPVILVLGGECNYIKGNRSSVGGESIAEKYFDDQEYYLNEGDTMYLFSDGMPDQFGGPEGKKMKVAKFKDMLREVSALSLAEQSEAISLFFEEWKGSYEQVDDILIMGVRV